MATDRIRPKKAPTLDDWQIGRLFGALVVRGYVDGRCVTQLFRWWSHERFGLSSGTAWVDGVFKVGRMAPGAFEYLEE